MKIYSNYLNFYSFEMSFKMPGFLKYLYLLIILNSGKINEFEESEQDI